MRDRGRSDPPTTWRPAWMSIVPGNLNPYGTCDGCNASGLPASGPFNIRDNVSGFARLQFLSGTAKYTQPFGNTTLTVIGDYSHFAKDYQEDSDASPSRCSNSSTAAASGRNPSRRA